MSSRKIGICYILRSSIRVQYFSGYHSSKPALCSTWCSAFVIYEVIRCSFFFSLCVFLSFEVKLPLDFFPTQIISSLVLQRRSVQMKPVIMAAAVMRDTLLKCVFTIHGVYHHNVYLLSEILSEEYKTTEQEG